MGYTTDFWGHIRISPPLNKQEIDYLQKFNQSRRMKRGKGDYFVDDDRTGHLKPGTEPLHQDDDVIDMNAPPPEQPGLWCKWTVTDDGKTIEWDGAEKFYDSPQWMWYIIQHFIKPNPVAKLRFPEQFEFLQGHTCNGEIDAQGEEPEDRWCLVVRNNEVFVERARLVFDDGIKVDNPVLEMRYCYEANKGSDKCKTCENRFKCYTGGEEPAPKYGGWGKETYWRIQY